MRIDGNDVNLNALLQVQQNGESSSDEGRRKVDSDRNQGEDRLELSTRSRTIEPLVRQASEAPEVRAERVAEISRQLNEGAYNVRAEKVAEAIITGAIIDERA